MDTMTDRVRAILITSDRQLATIKRIKPGRPAYWVLPGGGVEPGDATLEDALHREIREELGGTITVRALVAVVDHGRDRHHIYLADLLDHHPDQRTGPELTEPGHGQYLLDLIPLTPGVLASITLLPPQIAELLRHCLDHGSDLSALPDLRTSTRIRPPSQSS